jgi:hypothetical protein
MARNDSKNAPKPRSTTLKLQFMELKNRDTPGSLLNELAWLEILDWTNFSSRDPHEDDGPPS